MLPINKAIEDMTRKELMVCLDDCNILYETDFNKPVLKQLLESHLFNGASVEDTVEDVVEYEDGEVQPEEVVEETVEEVVVPDGHLTVKGTLTTAMGVVDSNTPQKTLRYLLNKYPEFSKFIG